MRQPPFKVDNELHQRHFVSIIKAVAAGDVDDDALTSGHCHDCADSKSARTWGHCLRTGFCSQCKISELLLLSYAGTLLSAA